MEFDGRLRWLRGGRIFFRLFRLGWLLLRSFGLFLRLAFPPSFALGLLFLFRSLIGWRWRHGVGGVSSTTFNGRRKRLAGFGQCLVDQMGRRRLSRQLVGNLDLPFALRAADHRASSSVRYDENPVALASDLERHESTNEESDGVVSFSHTC